MLEENSYLGDKASNRYPASIPFIDKPIVCTVRSFYIHLHNMHKTTSNRATRCPLHQPVLSWSQTLRLSWQRWQRADLRNTAHKGHQAAPPPKPNVNIATFRGDSACVPKITAAVHGNLLMTSCSSHELLITQAAHHKILTKSCSSVLTTRYSPSAVHHLELLTTRYSPSAVHHELSTVRYSPSDVQHRLLTKSDTHQVLFTTSCTLSDTHQALFTTSCSPSDTHQALFTRSWSP